jgi:hypothetical protein
MDNSEGLDGEATNLNENGCLDYIEGYMPHSIEGEYGVYINRDQFKKLYSSAQGQITKEGRFGKLIFALAADPDGPKTWLDIGTWNGRGTTTCILDGFQISNSDQKKCVSIELHPFMHDVASENLKDHPAVSQITFLKGTLGDDKAEQYLLFPEDKDRLNDMHYRINFETDMYLWREALTKDKPITLPFEPEAAVLDGGEYTGYVDWQYLPKGHLKYVFLDDAAVLKNDKVRKELLQSSEWTLLEEDMTDRNGWSVFVKTDNKN